MPAAATYEPRVLNPTSKLHQPHECDQTGSGCSFRAVILDIRLSRQMKQKIHFLFELLCGKCEGSTLRRHVGAS